MSVPEGPRRPAKRYVLKRETRGSAAPRGADFSEVLNAEQLRAATAGDGPLLILAGAGTGKTRTLVYRVAHLISIGIPPERILLLTFTRRAAEEMMRRAATIVGASLERMHGGTFHAFANAVLREHGERIGLTPGFTILDEGDAEDALALLRAERGLAKQHRRFPRKQTIRRMFSRSINCVLPLAEVIERDHPHFEAFTPELLELFEAYARTKLENQMVDYDDLLLLTKKLLEREPEVRRALSDRHRYVLVDEYQDTNRIQADIVRLVADGHDNVTVVGDDAQSIYAFRGAAVRNMHEFPERFPGTTRITLEENYRSTQPILDFTNALIAASPLALAKELRTSKGRGEPPQLVRAMDEHEQSAFIVQRVLELREEGVPLERIAVLFRSSFHAYDLELTLAEAGIPFVKRGGFKLLETAHVRDVVAHLRVLANRRDRMAWHRALSLLPGMGPTRSRALTERLSGEGDPAATIRDYAAGKRHADALEGLATLLEDLARGTIAPADAIDRTVEHYRPILRDRYDDAPKRERDLDHLGSIAERFETVDRFLADLALEPPNQSVAGVTPGDLEDERLVLSTIHSAKGMEWHAVFVIWVLDGRFPAFRSLGDDDSIEEERRLLYVAATRAREELMLSYPMNVPDRATGQLLTEPSRFLAEVPDELFDPVALIAESAEAADEG